MDQVNIDQGLTFDCYNPLNVKSQLRKSDTWHVINALNETTIRGFYCPRLKLHIQASFIPTVPIWSLEGRHEFYCGIFDSSGDRFFSGSHDGIVRVFDSSELFLKLIAEVASPHPYWSVVSLNLSPDERHIVYSTLTSHIQIISLETNKVTVIGNPPSRASVAKTFSACFDGSGSRVYAGHDFGCLGVYDTQTNRTTHIEISPTKRDVNAVAIMDPAGHLILTGSDDTNIRLMDLRCLNDGPVALFVGHMDGITFLDAKVGGLYFLSNSKDQSIRLWDIRQHTKMGSERQLRPRCGWDYRIHSVPRLYCNPRHQVSGSSRGDLSVRTLRGHSVRFTLIRARFSPTHSTGQRYAYSGSTSGGWFIWDLYTGELVRRNIHGCRVVRDVHWHPWGPMAVASEMSGSLTCWRHSFPGINCENVTASGEETSDRDLLEELDPDGQRYRDRLLKSKLRYRLCTDKDVAQSGSSAASSPHLVDSEDSETISTSGDQDDYRQYLLDRSIDDDESRSDSDWAGDQLPPEEVYDDPPTTRSRTRRRPRPYQT